MKGGEPLTWTFRAYEAGAPVSKPAYGARTRRPCPFPGSTLSRFGNRRSGLSAFRGKLAIPRISRPEEVNPKGIPSFSPGLRGTRYPGCESSKDSPTLKGLKHPTRLTGARQESAPCYNPFRVDHASGIQPRVARGSQPWAGRCNPFGIEERLPHTALC
jgi:hypothetical protein